MELPTSGRRKVDAFIRDVAMSNPELLTHYNGCAITTVDSLRKSYNKMAKKKKMQLRKKLQENK